ncbi:MAG: hypothetical protein MUF31_04160 [Akkermansiaceae bacterium]|jgi:hypothetical protein|nr:hypothetical protein [Akkermansiaceae bacterium]
MSLSRFILALSLTSSVIAATPPDLLRLADGELAGRFSGISAAGIIRWEREDSPAPLEFKVDKARHIALRGGVPATPHASTSHVELLDGDRIAGTITAMDKGELTLDSPQTGPIVIPRDRIKRIAPNPFGGRLIYAGPFSKEGWEIVAAEPPQSDASETEKKEDSWEHIAGHWYYKGGSDALRYPAAMPEQSIFRFRMDWRARPAVNIALHADFAGVPEAKENEGEDEVRRPDLPARMFGNALIVSIRANYATLQHCGYTQEGEPFVRHLRSSSSSVRIDESGGADFELRSNLKEGTVALFVDGSFWLQWNIEFTEDARPLGSGLGFLITNEAESYRITDLLVAEWNGMPDAARSFESPDRDIVLLTNGTDRLSGKVTSISEGRVKLHGDYADLDIPLEDVADLHFAESEKVKEEESQADGAAVRVHFLPIGRIHGKLIEASSERLVLESPSIGRIETLLDSASLLEFNRHGLFLQGWDDDL